MARRKGKLEEAGFRRVPDEPRRRYVGPDGKEVSYREAFVRATGETLEAATIRRGGTGEYRELYRLARQTREAARNGLLSQADLADRRQEAALAGKTLKQMIRGHGPSASTKEGVRRKEEGAAAAPRTDLFGRLVVERLHVDIHVERDPGEAFTNYMNRVRAARGSARGQSLIGPNSEKALLLVVLGRRDPESEYSVGDTP